MYFGEHGGLAAIRLGKHISPVSNCLRPNKTVYQHQPDIHVGRQWQCKTILVIEQYGRHSLLSTGGHRWLELSHSWRTHHYLPLFCTESTDVKSHSFNHLGPFYNYLGFYTRTSHFLDKIVQSLVTTYELNRSLLLVYLLTCIFLKVPKPYKNMLKMYRNVVR